MTHCTRAESRASSAAYRATAKGHANERRTIAAQTFKRRAAFLKRHEEELGTLHRED
jgi:hypothetical protein